MRQDHAVDAAIDLAEAILDALRRRDVDWRMIEQWAREVTELAARGAGGLLRG